MNRHVNGIFQGCVVLVAAALVTSGCGDDGRFGDERLGGNGGGGGQCDGFDPAAASLDEEEQRFSQVLNAASPGQRCSPGVRVCLRRAGRRGARHERLRR